MRLRSALGGLRPYVPGPGEREIRDTYGLDDIASLALNESPVPPFPEVVAAIAAAANRVNRYPETSYTDLSAALGDHLGVAPDRLWFGGGGAELLRDMTLAVAGPGTSVVFAEPSFVTYRAATTLAGAAPIPVALDGDHRLDLERMGAAVRPDTSLMFVCNPNNPTGTHVPTADVVRLISRVPRDVLVVVDEAYMHYVSADDYQTMVPLVESHPNLVVVHTFSKVYGLAGLRIGYAVGQPSVLNELRRVQMPFTANTLAQVAALEALQHQDQVKARVQANAEARRRLVAGLVARGYSVADSQANFVYCNVGTDGAAAARRFLERGVIVRSAGSEWLRISVGSPDEVDAVLIACDDLEPRPHHPAPD